MVTNDWTEKIEELERENAELKETIKGLRWEEEEYQKKLDSIDKWAMEVQQLLRNARELIIKIRGEI